MEFIRTADDHLIPFVNIASVSPPFRNGRSSEVRTLTTRSGERHIIYDYQLEGFIGSVIPNLNHDVVCIAIGYFPGEDDAAELFVVEDHPIIGWRYESEYAEPVFTERVFGTIVIHDRRTGRCSVPEDRSWETREQCVSYVKEQLLKEYQREFIQRELIQRDADNAAEAERQNTAEAA